MSKAKRHCEQRAAISSKSIIKNHWFGIMISAVILFFIFLSALIIFSPKESTYGQGFSQCTESLKEDLILCDGNFCVFKKIIKNTCCDIKVIFKGAQNEQN